MGWIYLCPKWKCHHVLVSCWKSRFSFSWAKGPRLEESNFLVWLLSTNGKMTATLVTIWSDIMKQLSCDLSLPQVDKWILYLYSSMTNHMFLTVTKKHLNRIVWQATLAQITFTFIQWSRYQMHIQQVSLVFFNFHGIWMQKTH